MIKLCDCGCGQKTWIPNRTNNKRGWIKGKPVKYCRGHQMPQNGKIKTSNGYKMILNKSHPKCDNKGYVMEHVLICEQALGKYLPDKSIPHHINENKADNRNSNLVLCDSRSYHNYLHRRMKAYMACGHASWRRCQYCQQWDDPKNLTVITYKTSSKARHKKCHTEAEKERRNKCLIKI